MECLKLTHTDCSKGPHGPIVSWDVSGVTDMGEAFDSTVVSGTEKFVGDISKWNVSKVTNMESMFTIANAFNRDVSKWDVSEVTDMKTMFYDAT